MNQDLKSLILNAEDIKSEEVEIPEWGGITVLVKGLSDNQHGEYQAKTMALRAKQGDQAMDIEMRNRRSELVVKCLYYPKGHEKHGQRIFTDAEAVKLQGKNAGVVQGLFVLINNLSGLNRSFEDKVKDAEGNSEADPS